MSALNRSMWAGGALLAALAFAPIQAAPLTRDDTASTDHSAAADDYADSSIAGAALASPATTTQPIHAAINAAGTGGASVAVNTAAAPAGAAVPERDMARSIREVSKPMFEELAHSDVAEAVRALDGNKASTVDAGLSNGSQDEDSGEPGARRRNWDGSGQQQARENSTQQPGANRDPGRDKARAALLMSGLIDEIKPWAFGAAVLYVLAYIAKFSLAARRRTVQRRMERRKHRSRNSQSSQRSRL